MSYNLHYAYMNYTAFPEHFTLRELSNTSVDLPNVPTGHNLACLRSVAWILEDVRSHVQRPLIINSGFRTPEVNAKVGGVPTSFHTKGCAVDISIRNLNPSHRDTLESALLAHYPCEFIKYDTFYHVAFDISRLAKSRMPQTFEQEYPSAFPIAKPIMSNDKTDL